MIYINFNIRWPSWWNRFQNVWHTHGRTPIPHKNWELEILRNDNLVRFELEWSMRRDHAGVNLELGLLGYELHGTIYDNRHWDHDNNCWTTS